LCIDDRTLAAEFARSARLSPIIRPSSIELRDVLALRCAQRALTESLEGTADFLGTCRDLLVEGGLGIVIECRVVRNDAPAEIDHGARSPRDESEGFEILLQAFGAPASLSCCDPADCTSCEHDQRETD